MPEKKKVLIMLSIVYDPSKPISEDIDVVLTRGQIVDTLTFVNYPGGMSMLKTGDEDEISISSTYFMNATIKKDDGTTFKTNVYREYVNEKNISFKVSEL